MKKSTIKFKKQVIEYKLKDYEFLEDYEIIEGKNLNNHIFTAKIKNTNQKVRFIKKKYSDEYFQRFKILHKLYKNGIVLADNMFIVEECQELYFYIIEAEIQIKNGRFQNLQQYMYINHLDQQERKNIIVKIKILVDCLHQEGQFYGGLNTMNIILDDQKHLFLKPFSLDIELKQDLFSQAYYPLQILQKIKKQEYQINEQIMLKWDIWSFGCIAAEVLLYNSPIFISTSIHGQTKVIHAFQTQLQTQKIQQKFKNLLINSLNKNIQKRSISIHRDNQEISQLNKTAVKTIKKSLKNHFSSKSQQLINQIQQLNLYLQDEQGDSELTLYLCSLQNIKIQSQLHIIVHLQKKYHFYIDSKSSSINYLINKKITMRKDFKVIVELLNNPVVIQLKEAHSSSSIYINLQTLTLISQGRRVWNKKLLGTYKAQGKGLFQNSKLKISCNLKSPQIFIQQQIKQKAPDSTINLQIERNISLQKRQDDSQIKLLIPQQVHAILQQKVLKQVANEPIKKKKKKKNQQYSQIPSISQISNTISSITEQFKKRLLIKSQNSGGKNDKKDEIQLSLQNFLHLQH